MVSSKNLKLLFVSDVLIWGFNRTFFEQCQYLVDRGHQLTVLAGTTEQNIPKKRMVNRVLLYQYHYDDAPHRPNPITFILKVLFQNYILFKEMQKSISFDCLSFYLPLSSFGVRLNRRARKTPKVYYFLCPWHKEYSLNMRLDELKKWSPKFIWHSLNALMRKWLERLMIQGCRRVVVLTDFARDELMGTHPISPSRIVMIPGAIDISMYKPLGSKQEQKQQINIPKDKFMLFTLRRLVPRMGLETLIKAMPLILQANPRSYLVIGGTGPIMEQLKELIHSLGLQNSVRLEGFIHADKVPIYYNAADLFILPSKALEGFGYVTIEALACGTPVLGTPIGATESILSKVDPSLLFKGTSAEDMADLIIEFSKKSPQVLAQLGKQGMEFILKNYTWDIVGPKIEKVCLDVTQ